MVPGLCSSSAVRTGQSGYEKRCMFENLGYEKDCMFEGTGYEKHCMFVPSSYERHSNFPDAFAVQKGARARSRACCDSGCAYRMA